MRALAAETAYYYQRLSPAQRQAYHAMRVGLEALAPSFSVPRLSGGELADIFFYLRLDHPELFYVVRFEYRFYAEADSVEFLPEYMFPPKQVREQKAAMEARITKLLRPALQLEEAGKEQFVHDFILNHVRYDKLKKPYSHEIIGPLGHGVGVCEGIAKTVKILCDRLGLWCVIAVSENNPEKGIKYRHAWNVLKLNGDYYHLDATFDNSLSKNGILRYDYYNLNDAQLFRDHEPPILSLPECRDGRHSWYSEKKLAFPEPEKLRSRAAQCVKKDTTLVFRYSGGYLTREILREILQLLAQEGEKKDKHPVVSMNLAQAVFQVHYTDALPEQELVLEDANEGEQLPPAGEQNDITGESHG